MNLKCLFLIIVMPALLFNHSLAINMCKNSDFYAKSDFIYLSDKYTLPLYTISTASPVDNNIRIVLSSSAELCGAGSVPIFNSVSITNASDKIESVSMQITSDYTINEERLLLNTSISGINVSWNKNTGKLTLRGPAFAADFEKALLKVEYKTLIPMSTLKEISVNLSEANFLPSTGHFYEFIPDVGVSWSDAKEKASKRSYYGRKGYLATISSRAEADFAGKQITGAGWLGGSDRGREGVWKWMTGPEAGTVFWRGGINGNTPNYAFWNNKEPNNAGNEDYIHITHNSVGVKGSWNDLPNRGGSTVYQPKGYIVEYGGFPNEPELSISTSVKINLGKQPAPKGIFSNVL